MKVKTSELIGAALDWAVAKCEGVELQQPQRGWQYVYSCAFGNLYSPSTDGGIAVPIIDRERICPDYLLNGEWFAVSRTTEDQGVGPTLLIAAMRCYVASKLGDIVDIPEELCIPAKI